MIFALRIHQQLDQFAVAPGVDLLHEIDEINPAAATIAEDFRGHGIGEQVHKIVVLLLFHPLSKGDEVLVVTLFILFLQVLQGQFIVGKLRELRPSLAVGDSVYLLAIAQHGAVKGNIGWNEVEREIGLFSPGAGRDR